MHDYHIVLDSDIQRKYEWDPETISLYCGRIVKAANEFFKDDKKYDCKRDMGTLSAFKMSPSDRNFSSKKSSIFIDNGAQRCDTATMTVKSLYSIFENKVEDKTDFSNMRILIQLGTLLNNIKENFITEVDEETFSYIMNDGIISKEKHYNGRMISAKFIIDDFFSKLFEKDITSFKNVCIFLSEYFGFVINEYEPTSKQIRLEKYNEINSLSKPQSVLHQMFSHLSENAEKNGCCDFGFKYNNCMLKGVSENDMVSYFFIKTGYIVLSNNKTIKNKDSAIDSVKQFCIHEYGDFDFFNTFFDDFELYYSLRTKQVRWIAEDTKMNNRLSLLITALVEPFIYKKSARNASLSYAFHLLKNAFIISNNCLIKGVKQNINKTNLIKLLTYNYIVKLGFLARCDGSTASDERSIYGLLNKDVNKIFDDINVFNKHLNTLKNKANECISSPSYSHIGDSGLNYGSKGTRFVASIIAMEGETMDKQFKDGAVKFLNFNEYEIDHILWQSLFNNSSIYKTLWNLRMMSISNNRSENKPSENGRFIRKDPSFPEYMHDKTFTVNDIEKRGKWISEKIHNVVNYALSYINEETIVNNNLLAYNVA